MKVALIVESMKAISARLSSGVFLAAGVTLLTAACATTPVQQSASATDRKVAQDDKQVCRYEKRTGTNFPKKMCRTLEEWAVLDTKYQRGAYDYTRQIFETSGVLNAKNCGSTGLTEQVANCPD